MRGIGWSLLSNNPKYIFYQMVRHKILIRRLDISGSLKTHCLSLEIKRLRPLLGFSINSNSRVKCLFFSYEFQFPKYVQI